MENIHKVASAEGKATATTCRTIKGTASKAKVAVQKRKEELKRANTTFQKLWCIIWHENL